MKFRPAKIALASLILFLSALVVLADSGHGHRLFAYAQRIPAGDKLGHFVLFGVLAFLANIVSQGRTFRLGSLKVSKASALVMAIVTLEECSQLMFRARTFDLLDLASDALGIWLFGRLAIACLNHERKQIQP
jgi:hypothetical protein